jgi:hypothetical protein
VRWCRRAVVLRTVIAIELEFLVLEECLKRRLQDIFFVVAILEYKPVETVSDGSVSEAERQMIEKLENRKVENRCRQDDVYLSNLGTGGQFQIGSSWRVAGNTISRRYSLQAMRRRPSQELGGEERYEIWMCNSRL